MSSVLSAYAQLPSRGQYFYCVKDNNNYAGFTTASLESAVAANPDYVLQYDGTILNTTDAVYLLGEISHNIDFSIGDGFRDMGKTLYVQQNAALFAKFTLVQLIDDGGDGREGVPSGNPPFWTCTWQSSGETCVTRFGMVRVVRTG